MRTTLVLAAAMAATGLAHAYTVSTDVSGGTLSVDIPDNPPLTSAGQVKAVPGLSTIAKVSSASGANGNLVMNFTNGFSTPENAYGVYTAYGNSLVNVPRSTPYINIPLSFSSAAASTAGYAVDFYGAAGGHVWYSNGTYGIAYSFKVVATDTSGATLTLLDSTQAAQGGTMTSSLSTALLATAVVPQGFALASLRAEFDALSQTLVPPTVDPMKGYTADYLVGVTTLTLRPAGASAVPEATTSAMMLIGLFGLAGVTAARRRDIRQA